MNANLIRDFPRVLIVSAVPLNSNSATGITLQNLFCGWPIDCIAQIYDDANEPDRSICNNFRRFSSGDIPLVHGAKVLIQRFRSGSHKLLSAAQLPGEAVASGSISHGALASISDIIEFKLPNQIVEWVRQFRPDIVYSILGSVRMMNVVLKLNSKFDVPVVAHFMDDWPSTAYSRSWILTVPRTILNAKLKSVLAISPRRMAICEDMASEFSRRYGGQFDYFMNCVEVPHRLLPWQNKENKAVRFGFVGGLHLNRWHSLLSVISVLQGLKDVGECVILDIYAPQKDLKTYGYLFSNFSVVGEMSTLKPNKVNEKLAQFDVLVHVESFLEEDSRYTRLSISTKIPQYMASGRPILAFGPSTLSSVRYVERNQAGLVVGVEGDVNALTKAAVQLIRLADLRVSLGLNGFQVATVAHSALLVRRRFRDVLSSAAMPKLHH